MEFDRANPRELEELIETLGGVNLPIVNGSHGVLAEMQVTRGELVETYEKCSSVLADVLEFGLWFLKVDPKEKREVRKDLVRGNRNELILLCEKITLYDTLAGPMELGVWQTLIYSPMYSKDW